MGYLDQPGRHVGLKVRNYRKIGSGGKQLRMQRLSAFEDHDRAYGSRCISGAGAGIGRYLDSSETGCRGWSRYRLGAQRAARHLIEAGEAIASSSCIFLHQRPGSDPSSKELVSTASMQ